ncbi:MAG: hypothetical protein Ct9H90mP13_10740 [Pseudomonadota bacterium]|nr:MAG: hypothetical protein Ct9H90mP13_10740 [Pseudomonadota bacterium]
MNAIIYGLICKEMEKGDRECEALCQSKSLVMYPIYAFGSEEQKKNGSKTGFSRGDRLFWGSLSLKVVQILPI